MDKVAIGNLIKERRKSLGRSQSNVCNGIFDVSTYSRIERGLVNANDDALIRLFERLGLSTETINNSISEQDDAIRQVIREASQANAHGNRKQALALLESINEKYENFSQANRQRYDTVDTMIAYEDGIITNKERLKSLEKAMRITLPDYNISSLPTLMTDMEAVILRYIANAYVVMENYNVAIKIYYQLNDRENRKSDKIAACEKLISICYNLSKCLGQAGRYDECIDVAKEGMRCCEYTDDISMLPSCMYNCAWSLVRRNMIGDKEEAERLTDKMFALFTPMTWNVNGPKDGVERIRKEYFN